MAKGKKKATISVASAGLALGAVVALLAAYALGTAGRSDADDAKADTPRTIVMAGHGTAVGVPDELKFSLAVSATRSDVATAMADSTRSMRTVLAALKKLDVSGKDIATTGLSIDPVYDYSSNTERLTGYVVNQRARVTVTDLTRAGKAMSAAASAGGNAVRISGISLDIADRAKLLAKARASAVADATAKAKEYAEATGQRLGSVTSLKEVSAPAPAVPTDSGMLDGLASAYRSAAKAVPIRAGQQDLDVRIQVVWSLT